MLIEGTIEGQIMFGRGACLQIGNNRVYVESEVFEDLNQLLVGVEVEAECFQNEKNRLIATAVTVVRCPAEEGVDEQQLHDGLTVFQANQSDAAEHGMTKSVNWRYRKQT